jgi:hypothetical protein
MTVSGRVEDENGKPLANADVAVLARPKPPTRHYSALSFPATLGQGKTDGQGRFRLTVPRTSGERHYDVSVMARSPGYGVAQHPFNPDIRQPDATLQLPRERVLEGCLRDLQGVPAAGVQVQVMKMMGSGRRYQLHFQEAPRGLAVWPQPKATDEQGRFTVHGVPRDSSVTLQIVGSRFARQLVVVNPGEFERQLLDQRALQGVGLPAVTSTPRAKDGPEELTWVLRPARTFEGTVTYADTKKSVPNARIVVFSSPSEFGYSLLAEDRTDHQTDEQGKFRFVPFDGKNFIMVAYPPAGAPYLLQSRRFTWPAQGGFKQEIHFALPRGVMLEGMVTESKSGEPVAGASVEYVPHREGNPHYRRDVIAPGDDLKQLGVSDDRGNFRLVALPGAGHLLVNAPTLDYLRVQTSERELEYGKPGGHRLHPSALHRLDLKPDAGTHRVSILLRRGVTVKGRLVGADGKPLKTAEVFYRSYIPRGHRTEPVAHVRVPNGTFELPGLDPDNPEKVYFLDSQNQRAAVLELPRKGDGKEPLTVRLEPCGTARVRVVDEGGKPVPEVRPLVEVLLTPGGSIFEALNTSQLLADYAWMINLDRTRYNDLKPDREGRFAFPTLPPGATIRVLVSARGAQPRSLSRTFTVRPGQTLDLKDLVFSVPK